jgi:hypothetical protein
MHKLVTELHFFLLMLHSESGLCLLYYRDPLRRKPDHRKASTINSTVSFCAAA